MRCMMHGKEVSPMRDLKDIRLEINEIDEAMGKLFERRMLLAKDVAIYKQAHDLPIFDKVREEQILQNRMKDFPNRDADFLEAVEIFYQTMMDLSKKSQEKWIDRPIKAGYYGVPGAFTHEAFIHIFGEEMPSANYESFEGIFQALEKKEIRYGVLPVENSLTGIINDVYDLLGKYDFYIVKECTIPIQQNLLGVPGSTQEEIREVYSHPQGFAQSADFLSNFPEWKLIPYFNTARSASMVAGEKDPTKACIAGKNSAKLYGLEVLKEGIQDHTQNFTRFVVIGTNMEAGADADKISLYFTLEHRPGSLFAALEEFSKQNLNLQRIESRPMKGKVWEYGFFVDIEGNLEDSKVVKALKGVREHCYSWKVLGNYKKV